MKITESGRIELSQELLSAIHETAMDNAVDTKLTTLWRNAYLRLAMSVDHLRLIVDRATTE